MINFSFLEQYGPLGNGIKGSMKMATISCPWSAQIDGEHLVIDDGDDDSIPLGPVSGETTDIVVYKPYTDEVFYYPSTLKIVSNAEIVSVTDNNNNNVVVNQLDDNTVIIKPKVVFNFYCTSYESLKFTISLDESFVESLTGHLVRVLLNQIELPFERDSENTLIAEGVAYEPINYLKVEGYVPK
jgi:hypothetical protein